MCEIVKIIIYCIKLHNDLLRQLLLVRRRSEVKLDLKQPIVLFRTYTIYTARIYQLYTADVNVGHFSTSLMAENAGFVFWSVFLFHFRFGYDINAALIQ